MRTSHVYIALLTLTISFFLHFPADGQEIFSFEGKEPLTSVSGHMKLILKGRSAVAELSEGLSGMGFRTDGYSSYLQLRNPDQKNIRGVSAWFALESFPTDTAAFFSVKDSTNHIYLGLCTDRFGALMLSVSQDNKLNYIALGRSVQRFKWINLGLGFSETGLSILLNGLPVPLPNAVKFPGRISQVLLGKDFRNKNLGLLDLTTINGLVDEVIVWDLPIDEKLITKGIATYSARTPILAIPSSRFRDDFSRPKYHLLPAANWTNETHGLIFYKGLYHIFNQKNASSLALRQINWGHFSSPDLVNWTEHRPALSPEKGYDENGIWSGHVVADDQGNPVISYTAGGPKMGIALAYPKDSTLIEWTKYRDNPVIGGQPEGYTRTDLRDTYMWKEGNKWYMVVGFGIAQNNEQKGALLLYSSDDMQKWKFLHTLFEGNPDQDNSGIFWEMPVFKKIGDKYILLVNRVPDRGIPARAQYWIGSFVKERFVPDHPMPRNLEVINRLLSPSVAEDKEGRICAIAIIPDEISSEAAYQQGWSHLYSIPRIWNLSDGKLTQSPHPALRSLRAANSSVLDTTVVDHQSVPLFSGQQYEVLAEIIPNKAKQFGFILHKNADQSEYTKIYYDADAKEMVVDQLHSSTKKGIPLRIKKDAFLLDTSKPVRFHVFVDGSVVEIFINDQHALTTRIFPSKRNSDQAEVFSEGGNIGVKAETWAISPARMNTDF